MQIEAAAIRSSPPAILLRDAMTDWSLGTPTHQGALGSRRGDPLPAQGRRRGTRPCPERNQVLARILASGAKLTRLRRLAETAAVNAPGKTLDAGLDEERTRWHSRLVEALTDPMATETRRETRHLKLLNEQPGAGSGRHLATTSQLVVMACRCPLESWAGSRTRSRGGLP